MNRQVLSGDEAVALAALHAGVGILRFIVRDPARAKEVLGPPAWSSA
jgi:hypothetical protein